MTDIIHTTEVVPPGYHHTNAGILPNEWTSLPLSSIVEEITETVGSRKIETVSISAGIGFVNQAEKFGKELSGNQYEKYTVLHQGDFSYNKGNSNLYSQGCIYRLNDRTEAAVPNVFESFRVSDGNPDYYEQLFISGFLNRQLYSRINRGVRDDGLLNLRGKDFYSCEVPCPPLAEQERIAEILMQCDKVIELKQKRIEEEKKKKRFLMQTLLNPTSGVRLPGFSGAWKETKIGDIAKMFSGGTPTSSNQSYYATSGVPFIRSGEISSSKTALFLSQAGYNNSAAKMVHKGDLLYALYGANSGECFISKIDGAINQAILCIRSDIVDTSYLYYVLANRKDWIVATYLQGGQGNLSGEIIKKLTISYPQREEQSAIYTVLNAQDSVIEKLKVELSFYQEKKVALAQLLLTGIVRTKKRSHLFDGFAKVSSKKYRSKNICASST